MANTNGALPHNFPGLLNLPGPLNTNVVIIYLFFCEDPKIKVSMNVAGFPGLPGPSGIPDNFGE